MADCDRCGQDTGTEPEGIAVLIICASCQSAADDQRLSARRERVGSPCPTFTFASIDQPDGLEDAIPLARAWAVGEAPLVGLVGPVGVGKTYVAIAAANELVRHRRRTRFYSAMRLMGLLGLALDNTERVDALTVLLGDYALVLDDFDKVRPSEYAAETLMTAIDTRVNRAVPLLITTNLGSDELSKRWPQPWGEALTSRLLLLQWARCTGSDKRDRP